MVRNQRKTSAPAPKRLPNQQENYEMVKMKRTGPGLVTGKLERIRAVDKISLSDKRRHADGKNHKNPKAKPAQSTIANEPDEGQHSVPSRVKFAKGVPNTAAMRKGYYPPGKKLPVKAKNLSDNTDYNSPATYSQQVHNDY